VICAHDQKREHGCLSPGTSANPTCRCPLARPIVAAARTRLFSLPVVLTKKARAIEAVCPCAFLYKARISQLPASPRGLDAKTRLAIDRDLIPDRHNENSWSRSTSIGSPQSVHFTLPCDIGLRSLEL
jgi:hypothetical protein